MRIRRAKAGHPPRLKLHAVDPDDLRVVAAALASATVKRGDIGLDRKARRFAFVCNRFRWEDTEFPDDRGGSRIRAGVQFNDVDNVSALGLAEADPGTVLELLNIEAEVTDPPAAVLELQFAGGAALKLEAGCIDVLVDDMGRAWYTPNRPSHETENGDGD